MKLRKGIWRSLAAALASAASDGRTVASVMAAVIALGGVWLAGAPHLYLASGSAALVPVVLLLALGAHFSKIRRGNAAGANREPSTATVLACKTLPKDEQLVPIWIGRGLLETAGGRAGKRPRASRAEPAETIVRPSKMQAAVFERPAEGLEGLEAVDPIRVEIGYAVVPLATGARSGEWLARIAALRRAIAAELGMLVPPVRIKDNIRLGAHEYVIKIHGIRVGSGKLYPSQLLALAGEGAAGKLTGQNAVDPAFGMPGVWIYPSQRRRAERMKYTVMDPAGLLMTHLAVLTRRYAADLLSREQVSKLLDNLQAEHPDIVAAVTERLKVAQVQKLLQNLLREGVSIADLKSILEAIGDAAEKADHVDDLTELAREYLGPAIARQHAAEDGRLWCVCLEPDLEDIIDKHLMRTASGSAVAIPRALHAQITEAVGRAVGVLRERGRRAVVLCAPHVRAAVRQLIAPYQTDAAVLGHNEVKSSTLQPVCNVSIEAARPRTYKAPTVTAAMAEVKRQLGRDATVLRKRKRGSNVLRRLLGGRTTWEVTAVAKAADRMRPAEGRYVPAAAKRAAGPDNRRPQADAGEAAPDAVAVRQEDPSSPDHVTRKMNEIHRMVEALVTRDAGRAEKFSPELREFYELLLQQDVAEEIASQIVEQLDAGLKAGQLADREAVAKVLHQQIAGRITTCSPCQLPEGGGRRVIALIGPTGVGKTTTIAKLAANFKLSDEKRVGLITIDTYRIAAVEQLRRYADIIEVPLQVVLSPGDLQKAVDSLALVDVVLIDTAGRSQNDKPRLEELHNFLADAAADETHLVVSATSNRACIKRTIENFAPMGANRIILTKLDEAETFGAILNVACAFKAPLSYVTTGQDVPDDICPADARQLAGRIMGGLVCVT